MVKWGIFEDASDNAHGILGMVLNVIGFQKTPSQRVCVRSSD